MDVFTAEKRSWVMQQVRSKDTRPERIVRSALHHLGYRFRLHRKDLPGKPDIVLPRHRRIILVHGCFWHGHPGCKAAARPTTNVAFWTKKLDSNLRRDREHFARLREMGWAVLVIWECETAKPEILLRRLEEFFTNEGGAGGDAVDGC
jgi:DNA mismatch endonuclease (patch repair protein)